MGFPQIAFARQMLLEPGSGRWALEDLPITGIMSTWSASNPTTDSGAAATAMASGNKTTNERIGTQVNGTPARSFTLQAIEAGWKVGYVTTTKVTHATPAAFYANVDNRYTDEEKIAAQLIDHPADVVLGGGMGLFLPASEGGRRSDGRNLIEEAEAKGWSVWKRGTDLSTEAPDKLLGLFADSHLAFRLDDERVAVESRDPSLAVLTTLALDVLSRDGQPFFLLLEGGRIDHALHSFDAPTAAAELRDFDEAIEVVRSFQRENPETLLVVTADHATGGLAINDYVKWDDLDRQRASVEWMGERIRNADAGSEMVHEMTGYDDITDEMLQLVREEPQKYEAWRHLARMLSERNGVTWIPYVSQNTKGHTGEDVPVYAGGPGAERFQGVLDNTKIADLIFELAGFERP